MVFVSRQSDGHSATMEVFRALEHQVEGASLLLVGQVVFGLIAPARVDEVGENRLLDLPPLDKIQNVRKFGIIPAIQRNSYLRG